MSRRGVAVLAAAIVAGSATACGGAGGDSAGAGAAEPVTVLAASSLTEAFTEIGQRFQAASPRRAARFSFDASSTLVQQAKAGAPADVLATADEATMQPAVAAGVVTTPHVFARNRLTILVESGNPRTVRSLADLARRDLTVVLCAPEVPCGRFGAMALDRAGVIARPRSLEPNVKGVVAKVTLGEADAGIVYVSDARAAGPRAASVAIPDADNVVAAYPIATFTAARHRAAAEAFVAFVRSDEGQAVLASAGFEP